ncbi:MATH domain and coiled-coil domain-containing protein At3g58210-like [Vicia villosa]|uniref:MATH domain and coiled-coil domain-containing protein At3g58210-like n=1 Tax=Vicia villosa TaxID=3911 RepID=UPI00273C33FC|nr:MATH domain and coiled-coil domain-containing protein At3g58210-like [Vicia villosa]
MEHGQSEKFEKFTWKVENFSKYNTILDVYSEPFIIGGYPWEIIFNQRGYEYACEGDLSIFLSAVETANMSEGWSRHVRFKLFLVNQIESNESIIPEEDEVEFNANSSIWGTECFVTSSELHDPLCGFLVKDTCIIGAEVFICNSKNERQVNQTSSLTRSHQSGSQTVQMESEVLRPKLDENNDQNLGKPVDFKDFGQIEEALVPLLEEICAQHPSLIKCQQKRSHKFREWAFNALGRVLYFLKTRKMKDMNDVACKELQIFWEELEHFGFDLTWLEPHVQSALGMKRYLEKLKEVEKLKDNKVVIELEIMRMKAKMVALEVNLHAIKDLLEAEDFEERDLDVELGVVNP